MGFKAYLLLLVCSLVSCQDDINQDKIYFPSSNPETGQYQVYFGGFNQQTQSVIGQTQRQRLQESQKAFEQNNAQGFISQTPSPHDKFEAGKVNSISGGKKHSQTVPTRSGETDTTQSNNNYGAQNNKNMLGSFPANQGYPPPTGYRKNGQSNQNNQFVGPNNAGQNNANPSLSSENSRYDNRPSNENTQNPQNSNSGWQNRSTKPPNHENNGMKPFYNNQNNPNGGSAENQSFAPTNPYTQSPSQNHGQSSNTYQNNGNKFPNGPQNRPIAAPQSNQQMYQTNSQQRVTKRPFYQQASNEQQGQKFESYKPISKFAWDLLKVSNTLDQNLVMCPLSPQLLLSYLAAGSTGETKNEIDRAISYKKPNQIETLIRSMLNEPGYRELQFATAFFIADNLALNPKFKGNDAIEIIRTDFTQPQNFQRTYNDWISKKTKGALPLIQAQADPATKMILSSAVYFKGGWIYKFNPAHLGTFTKLNNQQFQIPMMSLRKKLPFGSVRDIAEWVAIPYNSSDSMIVVKPKEPYNIETVMQKLQFEDIDNMIESLHRDNYANVNLTMPKFKVESTTNLVNPLQKMGIKKPFTRYSEIINLASEPLQISNAVQQAALEVNEEGSIATSLTSFSVVALSFSPPIPNIEFNVDRPFLAMIVNRDLKIPYFIAKISAP